MPLVLHENLRWDDHVDHITPKCYAAIASLRRLRDVGIPISGLLTVYKALFIPLLTYGITIRGNGYDAITLVARVLQNDAVRAMVGMRRKESVSHLYVVCLQSTKSTR